MIRIQELSVYYQDILALDKVSCTLQTGKITGIIGPNGAGKSTLLKAILGIIPHEGSIRIREQVSRRLLKDIAYVEQKAAIDYTFPMSVKECVSLGTYAHLGLFQHPKAQEWAKVTQALETVNLREVENRQIGELSGGQFQRVLVARCLVQEAETILLDEPFVGIDSVSEKIVIDTLKELKKQGKTILIVHHDLLKVREYFDEILILNKALVAQGSVATTFNGQNLKRAYGDGLFIGGEVGLDDTKFY